MLARHEVLVVAAVAGDDAPVHVDNAECVTPGPEPLAHPASPQCLLTCCPRGPAALTFLNEAPSTTVARLPHLGGIRLLLNHRPTVTWVPLESSTQSSEH